jgi:sporulation protein YlmC with PRC-barrel domain
MAKAKTDEQSLMVKLSDTTFSFADGSEDVRGRKVVDSNGEEIGEVNDLFIDQKNQKVRFLEIASGGFLGLGATKFLIPVDAISGLSEDEVRIHKTREHVASAPAYSPELVDTRFVTNLYDHYGYGPYWEKGYNYPPYPYYPPLL